MSSFTAEQISERVRGELIGAGDVVLRGIEVLSRAGEDQISFIRDGKYADEWHASRAGAALVSRKVQLPAASDRPIIRVDDADLAIVTVLEMYAPPRPRPTAGIHSTAVIDPQAKIGADVAIGAHCYVGAHAVIGDGCILHPGAKVMDHANLGESCEIFYGAVIRERCRLGKSVIIHSNSVIGSDGFGYLPAPDRSGLIRIPHIGNVVIGSFVEIGANTCVDRGKFSATVIGDGTKIDNLCQIAHNCQIGRCCVIAGLAGIAGSVTIGDGVVIGGKAALKDQISIGDGARLGACSEVMSDVPAGQTWVGSPAMLQADAGRQYAAVRRLPEFMKSLRKLHRESESNGK